MTKQEMQELLKSLGVKKTFKPYAEPETGALLIQVKKPAQIIDGLLRGSEICLQGKLFRVWTPRKRLAHDIAFRHGLKARLLDSEAELWIPVELADELLPKLGAKITHHRNISPERRLAMADKMRFLIQKHGKEGTSGAATYPVGGK
jgi:hypothetical protein